MSWTLWLDLGAAPGVRNMAIDQALLARAAERGERWLRLYRWAPHCLSFGRHEPAPAPLRPEPSRGAGPGHGAAAHGRPRSLARRRAHLRGGRSPPKAWAAFAKPAPRSTGCCAMASDASASRSSATDGGPALRPGAGACFAAPAGGELMLAPGRWWEARSSASAAPCCSTGRSCSSGDQRTVADVTRGAAPADLAGGLALALGHRPEPAAVADAVAAAAASRWPGAGARPGRRGAGGRRRAVRAALPLAEPGPGGTDRGDARLPPVSRRSLHSVPSPASPDPEPR